jgi:hypothetical protein
VKIDASAELPRMLPTAGSTRDAGVADSLYAQTIAIELHVAITCMGGASGDTHPADSQGIFC